MKIITLTTQKGGTGKTTLATSLAVAAMEAGETVAAFDLDPQGSLARWGELRTAETPIVETFPAKNVAQLPDMVRGLANKGFSLVIIDTPGADNTATHKAMEAASWCLVPIRPTRLDAMAVQQTVRALMRGDKPFAFVLPDRLPGRFRGRAGGNRVCAQGTCRRGSPRPVGLDQSPSPGGDPMSRRPSIFDASDFATVPKKAPAAQKAKP
ncbi:MAG TPA: ParA family protein, partial [Caulobacter sp.]|nr:ParA family protein [Caulobacter sp.]